jgi:hypothetical protein
MPSTAVALLMSAVLSPAVDTPDAGAARDPLAAWCHCSGSGPPSGSVAARGHRGDDVRAWARRARARSRTRGSHLRSRGRLATLARTPPGPPGECRAMGKRASERSKQFPDRSPVSRSGRVPASKPPRRRPDRRRPRLPGAPRDHAGRPEGPAGQSIAVPRPRRSKSAPALLLSPDDPGRRARLTTRSVHKRSPDIPDRLSGMTPSGGSERFRRSMNTLSGWTMTVVPSHPPHILDDARSR